MTARALAVLLLFSSAGAAGAGAEVLVRWDRTQVPPASSLGVSTLVIPARETATVRQALARGYRVVLEADAAHPPAPAAAARAAGILVRGRMSAAQHARLERLLKPAGRRVMAVEDGGKWPHIRSNWVTNRQGVLQVAGRSAQPWIDSNAALMRLARPGSAGAAPLIGYEWQPIADGQLGEYPRVENYLVAIAEAGSFGADLVLPLSAPFQDDLVLGHPAARAAWSEIRRYLDFYAWDLASRYAPVANIGVVTAEPLAAFEVMNLLARHNLPFERIDPRSLPARPGIDLLLVLDADGVRPARLEEFARKGGIVMIDRPAGPMPWHGGPSSSDRTDRVRYSVGGGLIIEAPGGLGDPNALAMEVRQALGRERRVLDVWNGITVLAAMFSEPGGDRALVSAVNYAHQPLPVQMRVRGTYSQVHYESPEDAVRLLPYEHRDGFTEFVIPSLRVGGRVFLSGSRD